VTREEALAGLEPTERQALFAALEKIRGNLSERGVIRIADEPEAREEMDHPRRRARHG